MPNSAACLIEFVVSPPAFAADDLRLRRLRLQQERAEVLVVERNAHLAEHLAAVLQHDGFGVAFERVAECVVGGQENHVSPPDFDGRPPVPLASIHVS
jgi:hypothetical protein